jgi:hypothetical protein
MKGIELPMNTIIVIILVLIVLAALLGLFYGVWPIGAQTANLEAVKDNACHMFLSTGGCDSIDPEATKNIFISNFDADRNGKTPDPGSGIGTEPNRCQNGLTTNDNLFMLCRCWYSVTGNNDITLDKNCRTQVCHCLTD